MANNYTIVLELSSDDIWDREIIDSLSKIPAEYARPLLKSEILRWSRGVNELTSINSVGLQLDQTLLTSSIPDSLDEDADDLPKGNLVAKHSVAKAGKKAAPVRIKFTDSDQVVDVGVEDKADAGLSKSEMLKNKIRGNYAESS